MTQKPHFFKLGLFMILAFALTAAMLIAFGAGQFFKIETLAETCFDESVQGLDIGSEVKYKGVRIGTVKSITTPAKVYDVPSNYVLVTFSLSEDCYVGQTGKDAAERMKKAIDQGLSIKLSFKGLTGAAYLETDYQGQASLLDITWESENLYLPSKKSNMKRIGDAMNQLMDTLTDLNIKGIGTDLAGLIKGLNEKVNALNMAQISDQAEGLLTELRQTNQKVTQIMESNRIKQIVADAGDSFTHLKTMLHDAKQPVGNSLKNIEKAASSVTRMTTALEDGYGPKLESLSLRMDTMLQSMEKTSKMLETMVWINSDILNKAVENFKYTSENLNQLSLELKQYPGRLLMEHPPNANFAREQLK
ncbi:MAG: MCE family protein [Desulfobacter sp.]|nr:MCE family protein [Desulfobacter sp.]WDP87769.1 MAG: MCE family protein [Desulfobacter sp.]